LELLWLEVLRDPAPKQYTISASIFSTCGPSFTVLDWSF
jgi:hypothetical protein